MLRSPIVSVLGHVDHGKTKTLDYIRGTRMVSKEAGKITQHVGASVLPKKVILDKCGQLLKKYGFELSIPGILFIDTPGHEAFTNLRKRGGSIADLAVLIIDVNQGIQPQTSESIEILKTNKVPFIVAANKIDMIHGWTPNKDASFLETFSKQRQFVKENLDKQIYEIVGKLGELGFNSERFDRVDDLTKNIIIVPISAETGEGFKELIMFLAGLSQKFMKEKLDINSEKPARGSILEVKEIQGLGTTLDVIIYEGKIEQGDKIAVATKNGVVTTKIRSLLLPAPLEEIRDTSKKFKQVKKVYAASGVKLAGPDLEEVLSGSPLVVYDEDEEKAIEEVQNQLNEVQIDTEKTGVVIKADALGSLEAIVNLMKDKVKIKKADVGPISKHDISEAESVKTNDRYSGVIFSFNVKNSEEIKSELKKKNIPLFESNVIYRLEEEYEKWKKEEEKREKEEKLEKYVIPAKLKIMDGHVYRISKPAVVGVRVLEGIIKPDYHLIREDGESAGTIQSIQAEKQTIPKAEAGMEVALALDKVTVGRQINEKDELYTNVPLTQLFELRTKKGENKELIKKIIQIKEQNK